MNHTIPYRRWKYLEYHREFFDGLAETLQLKKVDDWYGISKSMIFKHRGGGLLVTNYQASPSRALSRVYPDTCWYYWLFCAAPTEFWTSTEHQYNYMEWLGGQLNIQSLEDWYHVTVGSFQKYSGSGLLHYYNQSVAKVLEALYPSFPWQPWRFGKVAADFWKTTSNHRMYFEWLGKQLHVKSMDDWYAVGRNAIQQLDGAGLLAGHYHSSPSEALVSVFPEYDWQLWRFNRVPRDYWLNKANQREFFEWLAEERSLHNIDDWYKVSTNDVENTCGATIICDYFNGSLSLALQNVFPDTHWHSWNFTHIPRGCWADLKVHREYLGWLEDSLGINSSAEWYGITRQVIHAHSGKVLLDKYSGSLLEMLREHYPLEEWDSDKWILMGCSKVHKWIYTALKNQFSTSEVESNFWVPWLKFSDSQRAMQLDVWVPSRNVAVEVEGIQHYIHNPFIHAESGLQGQRDRDIEKINICERVGMKLIRVPFWWTFNANQLLETVTKDTSHSNGPKYIPESFPYTVVRELKFFLFGDNPLFEPSKGYNWNLSIDPTTMWASTKHNGIRILTDGMGNFFTKVGKRIFPPRSAASILSHGFAIEFEYCFEEMGGPSKAAGILRHYYKKAFLGNRKDAWGHGIIYVFDAPNQYGDIKERIDYAKHRLPSNPNLKFVSHHQVYSAKEVMDWCNSQDNAHLEGLMLHSPHLLYQCARHPSVLKVKVRKMEEGYVVGHHHERNLLCVRL